VFLGFDFEKIHTEVVANHLMATLVGWLRGKPIVPPENLTPVAEPGDDQVVWAKDSSGSVSVTLDGTASLGPDGNQLAYQWSEGGNLLGYTATLNREFDLGPHFVKLQVEDSVGAPDTATFVVHVQPPLAENDGPPIPAAPTGPSPVPPTASTATLRWSPTPKVTWSTTSSAGVTAAPQSPSTNRLLPVSSPRCSS
jgi:hypothetical protein